MDVMGSTDRWHTGRILVDLRRHLELCQDHHIPMELRRRLRPGLVRFLKNDTLNSNQYFPSIFAIVILTIEATPLTAWGPCAPYTEKIAEKTQAFKYWQRTIFYAL